MASIWLHEPGAKAPRKLKGHLDHAQAIARLMSTVGKLASANKAKVTKRSTVECLLQFPEGHRFSVYVEPLSPPSAPEVGQPKIHKGRGVLMTGKGLVELGVPS